MRSAPRPFHHLMHGCSWLVLAAQEMLDECAICQQIDNEQVAMLHLVCGDACLKAERADTHAASVVDTHAAPVVDTHAAPW